MTTLNDAFQNAVLADSAYVFGLRAGMGAGELRDTLAPRLTLSLANFVAQNFTVVNQITTDSTSGSSFDATVWRRISDGQIFVSMRGSQQVADFIVDADLTVAGAARVQLADMVNWWLRISTPAGEAAPQIQRLFPPVPDASGQLQYFRFIAPAVGTGELVGATGIDVNGHSLGGHLATAFARIFGGSTSIAHISTFNSAGFTNSAEAIFSNLQQLLGTGVSNFPSTEFQDNYFAANGLNVTTNSFYFNQIGQRISLEQEEGAGIANHLMYKLTDVLALGAMLERLDSTFTIGKLNELVSAGSHLLAASYEGVLNAFIRAVSNPAFAGLPVGDEGGAPASRTTFHQTLSDLSSSPVFQSLAGQVRINLVGSNIGAQARARVDFQTIVALQTLSPVVIDPVGAQGQAALEALWTSGPWQATYQAWQADRASLAAGGTASNFTDTYLTDRAAFLSAVLDRNERDATGILQGPQNIRYFDAASRTEVLVGSGSAQRINYLFGDDRADLLEGQGFADHLYGGAGRDDLIGRGGADWLEGNSGNDVLDAGDGDDTLLGGAGIDKLNGGEGYDRYLFAADQDSDRITDSDGRGEIVINGVRLTGDSATYEGGFVDLAYHGADFIDGEDGNDYIEGGGQGDTLRGGAANDIQFD